MQSCIARLACSAADLEEAWHLSAQRASGASNGKVVTAQCQSSLFSADHQLVAAHFDACTRGK